ncbi:MAG: type II secretion system F family protein, partial [Dehalococcoidia bacterium]
PNLEKVLPSLFGIKHRDIVAFLSQLATLLECGIAIFPALQLLEGQVRSKALRKVVSEMMSDLGGGSALSEAMSKHPQAFPSLYQRMIGVGEQVGNLEVMLRRAVKQMEKEDVLKKKVGRAMAYPVMVMSVAVVVVVLLVTVALPPIIGLFEGMNVALPLSTRMLMAFTDLVMSHPLGLMLTVIGMVALAGLTLRQPSVRSWLDRFMLRAPILGPMNMAQNMSRLTRTMSLLLEAGLPLPEILELTGQTVSNNGIRAALRKVKEESTQGKGLHGPMSEAGIFPMLLVNIVKVGEETGSLGPTLATLAESYEREAEDRISGLTAFIEPVMTVAIALVVGFIAISVITPIYSIMGSVD